MHTINGITCFRLDMKYNNIIHTGSSNVQVYIQNQTMGYIDFEWIFLTVDQISNFKESVINLSFLSRNPIFLGSMHFFVLKNKNIEKIPIWIVLCVLVLLDVKRVFWLKYSWAKSLGRHGKFIILIFFIASYR